METSKRAAELSMEAAAPGKRPRLSPSPAADPAAALSAECAAYAATVATAEQLAPRSQLVKMAVAAVERVVRHKPQWRDATCEPFGSSVTTLGTTTSDVDISINLPGFDNDSNTDNRRKAEQKLVKQIAGMMRRNASFVTTKAVPEARVPIVRCVLVVGGLQCDLSICNELAVLNSQLLRTYLLADPRVRPLALLIRAWGAARGVMGPKRGGLTSYALLLLLLSYLQQQVHPPILPQLQPCPLDSGNCSNSDDELDDADPSEPKARKVQTQQERQEQQKQADSRRFVQGFDCTFAASPPEHWQPAPDSAHSLGTLLHGFFEFYGYRFGRPTCSESGFKYRLFQVDETKSRFTGTDREAQREEPMQDKNTHTEARTERDTQTDRQAATNDGDDDDESTGALPPIVSLRMGTLLFFSLALALALALALSRSLARAFSVYARVRVRAFVCMHACE